jgi:hypothetical protein
MFTLQVGTREAQRQIVEDWISAYRKYVAPGDAQRRKDSSYQSSSRQLQPAVPFWGESSGMRAVRRFD